MLAILVLTAAVAEDGPVRNALAAPAPPPPPDCADDPNYFQMGVQWGVPTNWTSCTNWTGYTCASGGWGITAADDIDYLVNACPVSCKDGPCNHQDVTQSAYDGYTSYDNYAFATYDDECTCSAEWQGDGECDRLCNTKACEYDLGDCFHDDSGCYNHPTGADYRGNVSVTKNGLLCQYWESQWPNYHDYTVTNYPDSNLGGHNSCRNPDPSDGSTSPWCIVDSYESKWGYCDVGQPSSTRCPTPHPVPTNNHTKLAIGRTHRASVYEHRYDYYKLNLPAGLAGFQVVVVPEAGGNVPLIPHPSLLTRTRHPSLFAPDYSTLHLSPLPSPPDPNLYVSFDVPFPTGHNYTYKQDTLGVEVTCAKLDCGIAQAHTPSPLARSKAHATGAVTPAPCPSTRSVEAALKPRSST